MMCPRNCGPVTRQLRRVGSLCICHNPLRGETSSVARRSRALLVDFIFPLLVLVVPVADCKSYAFAARSTRPGGRSAARPNVRTGKHFRYNISSRSRMCRARSQRGESMTIKVGDRLPAGSLSEFIEVETAGCTLGPNEFKVEDLARGKKIVLS